MSSMTCRHCGSPINLRPIDQGGESYIARKEQAAVATSGALAEFAFFSYHTRCLGLANEGARAK